MTSNKEQLEKMLARSLQLCGYVDEEIQDKDTGEKRIVRIGKHEAVQNFMKQVIATCGDKNKEREAADKIVEAWGDRSGTLQKQLATVRAEQIGNFIATESTFKSAFFSTVTLAADEEPWYTNETGYETLIQPLGEDGKPAQVRVVQENERTAVGLYLLASMRVRYKTLDLMRGDVSNYAKSTLRIARDMTFKLDRVHYDLLNSTVANGGCFGAFTTEQARANKATRIYLPHSGVKTAHFPGSNLVTNGSTAGTAAGTRYTTVRYYDPASTTLSGLRPAVLLNILDYCNSWGNYLPDGGRLIPTGEIIVPASDIIQFALAQVPSANTITNSIQDQILAQGWFGINLYNVNWKFIPDNSIDSGTCFPRFNQLPGISYEKPSYDREFVNRNDEENWEERYQRKAYGAVIPSQWRVRAMKITYS